MRYNHPMQIENRPENGHSKTRRWQKPGCLGLGCAAMVFLPLLLYFFLWAAGGFLVTADPLKTVQAVVVLSGDDGPRLAYAAKLYRQQEAQYLIITETGERIPEVRSSLADMAVKRAIDQGVEEDRIIITSGKSQNTVDEAGAVRQVVEDHNLTRLIVVTDPYHTFRTRLIFRDQLPGVKLIIRPVPEHWYRSNTWFLSKEGWRETGSEYIKILAYLVGLAD